MSTWKNKVARFRAVMFDGKGMEKIFTHAGNTLTASFVIAAGLFAVKKGGQLHLLGVLDVSMAGYLVAAVGGALFLLN
jgi:hypothetical protein